MIIDASAVLAVFLGEPDARRYSDAMAEADNLRMPCSTWFEATMVADRRGEPGYAALLDQFLAETGITVEPLTATHMTIARQAWRRFGRGVSPARLNFGDCMVYGFAKAEGERLLFKGNDFSQTDIEPALSE